MLKQLDKTLELQRVPGAKSRLALVRKHLLVNNDLYVVSEYCNENLKARMMRCSMQHSSITRAEAYNDPVEAL